MMLWFSADFNSETVTCSFDLGQFIKIILRKKQTTTGTFLPFKFVAFAFRKSMLEQGVQYKHFHLQTKKDCGRQHYKSKY